jgi:sulfur carrier protein ThiS
MTRERRRLAGFAALAAGLAALLGILSWNCGPTPAPPAPSPGPAPAPSPPPGGGPSGGIPVPREWDPSPEQIAAAPEILRERVDEYTERFLPGPSRATLGKKAEVYRLARAFFKGKPPEQEAAAKALRELRLPTARFLVELGGVIVPKSERPKPDPESWDPVETPEDRALELVKDVMVEVIQGGNVDEMMEFFAAATGKTIDLDAALAGRKSAFRVFRVHPLPALFSLGDTLGCDMRVIDPDQPVIPLLLPVVLDMRIRGEDVRWLLENLARLGKFRAELANDVQGPVTFRVRAGSYQDAFRGVAERAGFRVEAVEGILRVHK